MMLETSSGMRVEILGDPAGGGQALYDSRDGTVSGVIAFDSLTAEIGSPLRYTWNGRTAVLPYGVIVNTLSIRRG